MKHNGPDAHLNAFSATWWKVAAVAVALALVVMVVMNVTVGWEDVALFSRDEARPLVSRLVRRSTMLWLEATFVRVSGLVSSSIVSSRSVHTKNLL